MLRGVRQHWQVHISGREGNAQRTEASGIYIHVGSWIRLLGKIKVSLYLNIYIQGGPSGRGMLFVDIKLKVQPEYKLLILKRRVGEVTL